MAAMAEVFIKFTQSEIQNEILYGLICTTRESSIWGTAHRRRRWLLEFTASEREACTRLFSQAHSWYLTKGVSDEVMMTMKTYGLWQKLGNFCASL